MHLQKESVDMCIVITPACRNICIHYHCGAILHTQGKYAVSVAQHVPAQTKSRCTHKHTHAYSLIKQGGKEGETGDVPRPNPVRSTM